MTQQDIINERLGISPSQQLMGNTEEPDFFSMERFRRGANALQEKLGIENEPVYQNQSEGTFSNFGGKTYSNANKIYNDQTPEQLQQDLSDAVDQQVFSGADLLLGTDVNSYGRQRDFWGNTAQENIDPNKQYQLDPETHRPVEFDGGAKNLYHAINPQGQYKVGVAQENFDERYADNRRPLEKLLDIRLPKGVATEAEATVHGNKGALDQRVYDLGDKKGRQMFGSGYTELYDENPFVDEGIKIAASLLSPEQEQFAKQMDETINPVTIDPDVQAQIDAINQGSLRAGNVPRFDENGMMEQQMPLALKDKQTSNPIAGIKARSAEIGANVYKYMGERLGIDAKSLKDNEQFLRKYAESKNYVPNLQMSDVTKSWEDEGLSLNTVKKGLQFGIESGLVSAPDMIAMMNPATAGTYLAGRTQEIADSRAKNDGRDTATDEDYWAGASTASLVGIFEKLGLNKIAASIKNGISSKAVAVATEGVTEFLQEGIIEHTGETYGTKKQDGIIDVERGIGGALGGVATSGAVTAVDAVDTGVEKLMGQKPKQEQSPIPKSTTVPKTTPTVEERPSALRDFTKQKQQPKAKSNEVKVVSDKEVKQAEDAYYKALDDGKPERVQNIMKQRLDDAVEGNKLVRKNNRTDNSGLTKDEKTSIEKLETRKKNIEARIERHGESETLSKKLATVNKQLKTAQPMSAHEGKKVTDSIDYTMEESRFEKHEVVQRLREARKRLAREKNPKAKAVLQREFDDWKTILRDHSIDTSKAKGSDTFIAKPLRISQFADFRGRMNNREHIGDFQVGQYQRAQLKQKKMTEGEKKAADAEYQQFFEQMDNAYGRGTEARRSDNSGARVNKSEANSLAFEYSDDRANRIGSDKEALAETEMPKQDSSVSINDVINNIGKKIAEERNSFDWAVDNIRKNERIKTGNDADFTDLSLQKRHRKDMRIVNDHIESMRDIADYRQGKITDETLRAKAYNREKRALQSEWYSEKRTKAEWDKFISDAVERQARLGSIVSETEIGNIAESHKSEESGRTPKEKAKAAEKQREMEEEQATIVTSKRESTMRDVDSIRNGQAPRFTKRGEFTLYGDLTRTEKEDFDNGHFIEGKDIYKKPDGFDKWKSDYRAKWLTSRMERNAEAQKRSGKQKYNQTFIDLANEKTKDGQYRYAPEELAQIQNPDFIYGQANSTMKAEALSKVAKKKNSDGRSRLGISTEGKRKEQFLKFHTAEFDASNSQLQIVSALTADKRLGEKSKMTGNNDDVRQEIAESMNDNKRYQEAVNAYEQRLNKELQSSLDC